MARVLSGCVFSSIDLRHIDVLYEEIAFKGMGASFNAVGNCSGLIVLALMAVAALIGADWLILKINQFERE